MKWLLGIPHYVILALLWIAFTVLTVIALIAVVATGRYLPPRSTSRIPSSSLAARRS